MDEQLNATLMSWVQMLNDPCGTFWLYFWLWLGCSIP